jgi:hypothetical protein
MVAKHSIISIAPVRSRGGSLVINIKKARYTNTTLQIVIKTANVVNSNFTAPSTSCNLF